MKVMITGAAGFIGGFLARHCLQAGASVLGTDIKTPGVDWTDAGFALCDIRDADRMANLISTFRPQRIFHLAAQSYPTVSLVRPQETMDINANGTINVFEGARSLNPLPVVVVACSSAEYGPVASKDLPTEETHPLQPLHPYGVSKVAQDLLAAQYFANYGIPAVRIRIFNTTGPGKVGDVCSDLTRRAVEIELGLRPPPMIVGNTTSRRAIVDVRDFVRALWLSAEHGIPGDVYNIGADKTYSVQDIIEAIREQLGVGFQVQQEASLVRSCDEAVIVGSNVKFRSRCAWTPEVPLTTTLRDMLSWWRTHLAVQSQQTPQVPVGRNT